MCIVIYLLLDKPVSVVIRFLYISKRKETHFFLILGESFLCCVSLIIL